MAKCKSQKFTGRLAVLEYAIKCGDAVPGPSEWKRLGAMRTKDLNIEWETADGTADDSIGSLRENLATFQGLSVSGDGTLKVSGSGSAALIEMTKHVAKPEGGEPVAWIRLTYPDLTFTFFAVVTNMSRSAPYDDVATYSFEASATASDFGLIVEDTPSPDAAEVDSVEAYPTSVTLSVGGSRQLMAAALPVGAPSGIVWSSSDPEVATVTQNGVVTGIAAGPATVTAASTKSGAKKATVDVAVS